MSGRGRHQIVLKIKQVVHLLRESPLFPHDTELISHLTEKTKEYYASYYKRQTGGEKVARGDGLLFPSNPVMALWCSPVIVDHTMLSPV